MNFSHAKTSWLMSILTLLAVAQQTFAVIRVDSFDDDPYDPSNPPVVCNLRNAIEAVTKHQPVAKCVDWSGLYQEIHILPSAQSIILNNHLRIITDMKIVGVSDENDVRPSIFGAPPYMTKLGVPFMQPLVIVAGQDKANPIAVSIENINFRDNIPPTPNLFNKANLLNLYKLPCAEYNNSYDTYYCAGGLLTIKGNARMSITDSVFMNGTVPEFTFSGELHGRIIGAGGAISVTSSTSLPKAKLSLNRVEFYNNKIVHYNLYKYDGGSTATSLTSRDQGVGAALFLMNANLEAKEVIFKKNVSANYPAIFVDDDNDQVMEGISTNDTIINMDHVFVEGNTASYGSDGYNDNVISGHVIGFRTAANHTDNHTINLSNMVIRQNDGGGIFASGFSNSKTSAAPIQIQKTAIVENNPDGWYRVAGLYLTDGSRVHMVNSTIGENMGAAWSGAIRLDNAKLSLLNNTIVESSALVAIGSTPFTKNIVSMFGNVLQHTKAGGTVCDLTLSAPNYGFWNVESDNSCQLWQSNNLVNTDPKLLPLAPYGVLTGQRPTYAYKPDVQAGSPVLDYLSSCLIAEDQRGTPRQNICDAGAFEYVSVQ